MIEGVDAPDGALHKNLVLIQGNQLAEDFRRQPVVYDGAGGLIPRQHPVRHGAVEQLARKTGRLQLASRLRCGPPAHQRFRLGQGVGEHCILMRKIVVLVLDRDNKIRRYEASALMHQLVEGMLAVVAGRPPDDWASLVTHHLAMPGNAFAVALHLKLLKISREMAQAVVVREDRMGRGTEEVDVPHPQQTHEHRHVPLPRRGAEVLIHGMRAVQKLLEAVHAYHDRNRQTDGRPKGITTAHPIPELKHVGRVDAEGSHLVAIGGHGHEMLGHCRLVLQIAHQPGASGAGIGQGFLRGERL